MAHLKMNCIGQLIPSMLTQLRSKLFNNYLMDSQVQGHFYQKLDRRTLKENLFNLSSGTQFWHHFEQK